MRWPSYTTLVLCAALAGAAADLSAARATVGSAPANLVDFTPTVPGQRDPVGRFAAVFSSADFAHRDLLQEAHARLESEIDAEIEHRRASGARLSKLELKELSNARAMLRSSLATLMVTTEDSWDRARRQAQMTLEAVRIAYSALHPQQLAAR